MKQIIAPMLLLVICLNTFATVEAIVVNRKLHLIGSVVIEDELPSPLKWESLGERGGDSISYYKEELGYIWIGDTFNLTLGLAGIFVIGLVVLIFRVFIRPFSRKLEETTSQAKD